MGARALILCPSRELALQTKLYVDKISSKTDLRSALFVGGESIQDQFNALLRNPDILVATPGRLLQVVDELNQNRQLRAASNKSISSVECVDQLFKAVEWAIFDEADVLLELGLAPQVYSLFKKLPKDRVTALFSATLPKGIVELAQLGLKDPKLLRLDVEQQLSPTLETIFLAVPSVSKEAALLSLLTNSILTGNSKSREDADAYKDSPFGGLIFTATKHHVEYLHELLSSLGISHGSLYGTMDPQARTEALSAFKKREHSVLIVTDLAARGLDLPFLQWVLHYDFPPQEKLFVHRAGRVARAGRPGSAYALVSPEELPYLVDLSKFLGKELVYSMDGPPPSSSCLFLGQFPSFTLSRCSEKVTSLLDSNVTLSTLKGVTLNAMKLYSKTRPAASTPSFDEAKKITNKTLNQFPIHPMFVESGEGTGAAAGADQFLAKLRQWKPNQTIFEAMSKNTRGDKMDPSVTLVHKRRSLLETINSRSGRTESTDKPNVSRAKALAIDDQVDEETLRKVFTIDASSKGANVSSNDGSYFMSYEPQGKYTEEGLKLNKHIGSSQFMKEVSEAAFDMLPSTMHQNVSSGPKMVWDKRHKKFVKVYANHTRPEAGSSFLTTTAAKKQDKKSLSSKATTKRKIGDLYHDWKKKFKGDLPQTGASELSSLQLQDLQKVKKIDYRNKKKKSSISAAKNRNSKKSLGNKKPQNDGADAVKRSAPGRVIKREVKTKDEILKARRTKSMQQERQKSHLKSKRKR